MDINVNQIHLWMARRDMNQSDIARKSGLTKQQVSLILAKKACSPRNLGKIANALGVDPGEIAKI